MTGFWIFHDGSEPNFTFIYTIPASTSAGAKSVIATITDNGGNTKTRIVGITVNNPETVLDIYTAVSSEGKIAMCSNRTVIRQVWACVAAMSLLSAVHVAGNDTKVLSVYSDTYTPALPLRMYAHINNQWRPLADLETNGNGAPGDEAHALQISTGVQLIGRTDNESCGRFPGGVLRFWVRAEAGTHLFFDILPKSWAQNGGNWQANPAPTEWTMYEVPLTGVIEEFGAMKLYSWTEGKRFWIDNIHVVVPASPDTIRYVGVGFNLNPVINEGSADPSVKVFNDTVYIFPSHDNYPPHPTDWYMNNWKVYSTVDLNTIIDHGVIVDDNDVLWKGDWINRCWAPDAAAFKGKYYFYFPIGWDAQIGVAVADHPTGPYTLPLDRPLVPRGLSTVVGIDPAAFIDDDGTPYLIWGQQGMAIAQLNTDMISFASAPTVVEIQGNIGIFEGPFLFKRGEYYYMTYSRLGSAGFDHIDYAMSKNIYGPYQYHGAIIGHGKQGNEHGSVFTYKGQWYVAYHAFEQSDKYRQTCFEYIHFNDDGTIPQVYPTAVGVGKYYGNERIPAENYFEKSSGVSYRQGEGDYVMTDITDGAYLVYPNIDFGAGKNAITIRASVPTGGVRVDVRLDGPSGWLVGTIPLSPTGGLSAFADHTASSIGGLEGIRGIALVFRGGSETAELCRVDWLEFGGSSPIHVGVLTTSTRRYFINEPFCGEKAADGNLIFSAQVDGVVTVYNLSGRILHSVSLRAGSPKVLSGSFLTKGVLAVVFKSVDGRIQTARITPLK